VRVPFRPAGVEYAYAREVTLARENLQRGPAALGTDLPGWSVQHATRRLEAILYLIVRLRDCCPPQTRRKCEIVVSSSDEGVRLKCFAETQRYD
jgi:hypothetical protein